MRRLLLPGLLANGLLLLGIGLRDGRLLALAIPLVLYLGAALFAQPARPALAVTRGLSIERASRHEPVVVRVSITNEGPALQEVLVEDLVPDGLDVVAGEPRLLAALPSGAAVEVEYTVRGERGAYAFEGVQASAFDPLGIARWRAVAPAPDLLTVLPRVIRLRRVVIRPQRTLAYAGSIPARQGGSGIGFYGVREYQSGDPLGRINWRMSARRPRDIYTNEFEQERIADVGLILDARMRSDVQLADDALFEHAVCAAASLADVFLGDGNRVGLLVYGGFLDWTYPGYGKVQRERIVQALTRAQVGESQVFDSLDYVPTRFFPARSQLVLISPLFEEDLSTLVRLRARGYQLLVVSPDPVSFEVQGLGERPGVAQAVRIAHLERALLLRRLQRTGVQVVNWPVDRPFDRVVHASLGRRPHWVRGEGT